MQLADTFHNDPNFDVKVSINFKNAGEGAEHLQLMNNIMSHHSRKLSQVDLEKMINEPSKTNQVKVAEKQERQLRIDTPKKKIDMNKFKMPKNLY